MNQLLEGDARAVLSSLPEESVHCIVTSPPYLNLRDYGVEGQIGNEETPEEYVAALVEVFREAKRVLRKDGTLFLNLGDSYASGKGSCYNPGGGAESYGKAKKEAGAHPLDRGNRSTLALSGLKPKDLIGMPWRVAFALQADGWYLRSDIIWRKLNPMPSSVKDRCTSSHEYLFMLTKSPRYFFDNEAIKDPVKIDVKNSKIKFGGKKYPDKESGADNTYSGNVYVPGPKKNKRDVWDIPTASYKGAHFAVFPEKLVEPCILAGTSEFGVCPHCGAPYERATEKGAVNEEWKRQCGADSAGEYNGTSVKDYDGALAQDASETKRRILENSMKDIVTIGWIPTCQCTCPDCHSPIWNHDLIRDPSIVNRYSRWNLPPENVPMNTIIEYFPSCECGKPVNPVPATVLDPFSELRNRSLAG